MNTLHVICYILTAIILRYTKNIFIKYAIANHIPWKQISQRIHWCNFYSNRSTFEKVIEKIQKVPDFLEHGV